jgi:hypothetical protein
VLNPATMIARAQRPNLFWRRVNKAFPPHARRNASVRFYNASGLKRFDPHPGSRRFVAGSGDIPHNFMANL